MCRWRNDNDEGFRCKKYETKQRWRSRVMSKSILRERERERERERKQQLQLWGKNKRDFLKFIFFYTKTSTEKAAIKSKKK